MHGKARYAALLVQRLQRPGAPQHPSAMLSFHHWPMFRKRNSTSNLCDAETNKPTTNSNNANERLFRGIRSAFVTPNRRDWMARHFRQFYRR